jgi:hypothetical protein
MNHFPEFLNQKGAKEIVKKPKDNCTFCDFIKWFLKAPRITKLDFFK